MGSISISVTVNYEGVSHPPQWASDGEKLSPHFSIRSDVSLITEIEMLTKPCILLTNIKMMAIINFRLVKKINSKEG